MSIIRLFWADSGLVKVTIAGDQSFGPAFSAKKTNLWEHGQLAGPVTTRNDRSPEKHEKPAKLPRTLQELRRDGWIAEVWPNLRGLPPNEFDHGQCQVV